MNKCFRSILTATAVTLSLVAATTVQAADQAPAYPKASTALLIVDPYNDFLSEGGKLWGLTKETAEAVHLVDHMKQTLEASRAAGIKVFIVPHRRYRTGDWEDAQYLPYRLTLERIKQRKVFEAGSWGGEFRTEFAPQDGDVVAGEHWVSDGFLRTNLDEELQKHGIDHVVLMGMRANTCVESTLRGALERGYHTTIISDAVAAFNFTELKASVEINYPIYAHTILTADKFEDAMSALK
jgi:nicotinamidase-related amidase